PGIHKLPILDPLLAYSDLFWGADTTLTPEVRRRLQLRQSALDAATTDLRALQSRLGPDGRARLEGHAEALRTDEQRRSQQLAGQPGPGATCPAKPVPPRDYRNTAPQLLVDDEAALPAIVRTPLDLL